MQDYLTVARAAETEFTEKKSRFIGNVFPITSEDEARELLEGLRKKYHDARHHCWCFRLADGTVRYSDDGEPQGTAGQPMLAVYERENIQNVLCVVTRYFGGILLGTGGLTRAYAKSAKDALNAAGIARNRVWNCVRIVCGYALLEQIRLKILSSGGAIDETQYGADIALYALIPPEQTQTLSEGIRELSAGRVAPEVIGQTYRIVLI